MCHCFYGKALKEGQKSEYLPYLQIDLVRDMTRSESAFLNWILVFSVTVLKERR